MEQQNNVKEYGKFFYVEPNIDGPVNLEDLSVYAELRVSFNQTKTVKKDKYVLQMKISNNGNSVNLYSGENDYDNNENVFLSTSSYSNYTYKDIEKGEPTNELFGVEAIDVSYNSFVVPEVTIKFTDIKGAALHAAEEYVLNESSNETSNMPKSSKFLSCFFTVPYPRFELYLKGFYGKPVFYDLSCASFKTEFHADTGNYSAVATLVGYSFSLLSDVTMCSLIAAPLSTYAGKEYWTQSNFKFDDGITMPTFQDLIVKWKRQQHKLKKLVESEAEKLDASREESEASEAVAEVLDGISTIDEFNKEKENCIGSFDSSQHKITFKDGVDGEKIKEILTTIDEKMQELANVEFSFEESYNADKKEVDFSSLVESLQSSVNEYKEQNANYEKAVDEKLSNEITNLLGFKPTVSNITKMCFAHLETLLYMFEQVKISKRNLERIFPRYLATDTKNNVTKIVETWSGVVAGHENDAETSMVRGLVSGIKSGQKEEQEAVEENKRIEEEDAVQDENNNKDTESESDIKIGKYQYFDFKNETIDKWDDFFVVYRYACPLKKYSEDKDFSIKVGKSLANVVYENEKKGEADFLKNNWVLFNVDKLTNEEYRDFLQKKYKRDDNGEYDIIHGYDINHSFESKTLYLPLKEYKFIKGKHKITKSDDINNDNCLEIWYDIRCKMEYNGEKLSNYVLKRLIQNDNAAEIIPTYMYDTCGPFYSLMGHEYKKEIIGLLKDIEKKSKDVVETIRNGEIDAEIKLNDSDFPYSGSDIACQSYVAPCDVDVEKVCFEEYTKSFKERYDELRANDSSDVGGMINQAVTTSTSSEIPDYLELNVYRYLKQLWDRWVLNEYYGVNEWKMKDVFDGPTKRVHLIDSSFNELGDTVVADGVKMLELLESCKKQNDLQMLSFLSKFYADNNCSLHNVQNFMDMRTKEGVSKIFKPINHQEMRLGDVKRYSDLVVLFSYQAASSQEDSFNIGEDLPSQYNGNVGGNIPSFGIAFGMQNQNYFMDVGVSMNTPNITDQSIQALFQIVDSQLSSADSETGVKLGNIGSNLYRVYANHAYQCTIKMMGCAWIQPLMYFQLMNIPLFRGAYIIHKVTHSMTPNNMITTFVGTKVSSRGMKALDGNAFVSVGSGERVKVTQSDVATVSNNCPYPFKEPTMLEDLNEASYKVFLQQMIQHFEKKMDGGEMTYGQQYSMFFNNAPITKVTDKYKLISVFCNACLSNINTFKDCNDDNLYNAILNLFDMWELNASELTDKDVSLYGKIKECFTNPISFLINGDNGFSSEDKEKYNTFDNVEKVSENPNNENGDIIECKGETYFIISSSEGKEYFNLNKQTNDATKLIDNILKSINYSVTETKSVSGVTVSYKENNDKKGYYVLSVNDTTKFDIIFDIIVQNYSNYFSYIGWKITNNNDYNLSEIIVKVNEGDIINHEANANLQIVVCDENYETITGSCKSFNDSFCMSIIKKYQFKRQDGKYISIEDKKFKTECLNFVYLIKKDETWEDDIISYFNNNYSNIIIEDCDEVINKVEESMKLSNQGFNLITTPPTNDGEQWHGFGPEKDPGCNYQYNNIKQLLLYNNSDIQSKNLNNGQGLTKDGSAQERMAYVADQLDSALDANAGMHGNCAGPPRQMMGTIGYSGRTGLGIKVYDTSTPACGTEAKPTVPSRACRFWEVNNWIGMNMIGHGTGKSNAQFENVIGGKLQSGDISITAGLTKSLAKCIEDGRGSSDGVCRDWYGHIQMYCENSKTSNKKWLSDGRGTNVLPYKDARTSIILRGATLKTSYAGSVNNDLFKEITINDIDNYFPSCYFFYMLFRFEAIAAEWYNDVGQHAIGLGCSFNESAMKSNSLYKTLANKYPYTKLANPCRKFSKNNENFTSFENENELSIEGVLDVLMKANFYDAWLKPLRASMKKVANAGYLYNQLQWDAIMEQAWAGQAYVTEEGCPKLFKALKDGRVTDAEAELNLGEKNGGNLPERRKHTRLLFKAGTDKDETLLNQIKTEDSVEKYTKAVKKLRELNKGYPYHIEED